MSGSADKTVRVWATDTWQQVAVLEGHASYVEGIALSGDGRYDAMMMTECSLIRHIVSCSSDRSLRVWAVEPWQQEAILAGHTDDVNGLDVSRDGR